MTELVQPLNCPCLCCGHLVHSVEYGWPSSYSICEICYWQDDYSQLLRPMDHLGANYMSLYQAQQNYIAMGVCDKRLERFVRPASPAQPIAVGWRPIDPTIDIFDVDWTKEKVNDWRELCWWMPQFRRGNPAVSSSQ